MGSSRFWELQNILSIQLYTTTSLAIDSANKKDNMAYVQLSSSSTAIEKESWTLVFQAQYLYWQDYASCLQ